MKKNTVIASIVLLLVSFLFLGMTQKDVSADMLRSDVITGYNFVKFMSDDRETTYYTGWVPRGSFYYLQPPAVPDGCRGWYIDGDTNRPFQTGFVLTENVTVIAVPYPEDADIMDYMYHKSGLLVVDSSNDQQPVALTDQPHSTPGRAQAVKVSAITDPVNWSFELVTENGAPKCIKAAVTGSDCYYYVKSSGKYLDLSGDSVGFSDSPKEVFVGLLAHNVEGGSENSFLLMAGPGGRRVNLKGNTASNGFQNSNGNNFTNVGEIFYFYPYEHTHEFTVTFDTNGGELPAPDPKTVRGYTDIQLPEYDGTKDGKAFVGWTLDRYATSINNNYTSGKLYRVSGDVTFYAVYSSLVKITLDPGVGGWVQEPIITAVKGTSINLEQPQYKPVYGKHEFLGWGIGTGANFNNPGKRVNQKEYIATSNTTLYAVWDTGCYVYFNFNGSGIAPRQGELVEPGRTVNFPLESEVGSLYGHTFAGWSYYNTATSVDFDKNGKDSAGNWFTMPDRDVTLYAVWLPETVTVTLQENGGPNTVDPITGRPGDTEPLPELSGLDGFTFVGWADSPDSLVPAYLAGEGNSYTIPANDKVLYAVWRPNRVKVTFDTNGGTGSNQTKEYDYGSPDEIEIPAIDDLKWERSGYTFLGWSTDKKSVQADKFGTKISVPTRDLTIYAVWQKNEITVTFDKNGGSSGAPGAVTKSKDEEFTAPAYEGSNGTKVFIGWGTTKNAGTATYLDGKTYKMPPVDTTLYAVWKNSKSITLTFDVQYNLGNGKSLNDSLKVPNLTPRAAHTFAAGSNWDLAGKNGDFQFVGWKNEQTGDIYEIGKPFFIPDQNTKLVAQWTGDTKPKVCIYWNDGTGAFYNWGEDPDAVEGCKYYSVDSVINFPDAEEYSGTKKNRADLLGWMDLASYNNIDGYHRVYQPGESYTVIPKTNQSFYAIWNESFTDALKFGIRLDGNIPEEPANFEASDYTTKYQDKGGNVFAYKALNKQQWVVDTTYDIRVIEENNLWYAPNRVTENIAVNALPSADDVRMMMAAAGKSFDPEKQFVLWYVIKWQNNKSPYAYWHVDGVVLNRAPYVGINYHQNLNQANGNVLNMPAGYQVLEGTFARIGAESKDGKVKDPSFPGYTFLGWSLTPDGEVQFTGGERYEMTRNLDLYGVWRKNNVTIKVTKEWDDSVLDDEKQPVSVDLYSDGNLYISNVVLNSGNSWSTSISVPKYNENRDPIHYRWEEMIPDGARFVQKQGGYDDHAVTDGSGNTVCEAGFGCNVTITNTRKIIPLMITAASLEWTYDGQSHNGNNPPNGQDGQPKAKYTISSSTPLEPGHEISTITFTGSVKDVGDGTKENEIEKAEIVIIDKTNGKDVTDWYVITTEKGTLTINPRPITVTAPVLTKVYGKSDDQAEPVVPNGKTEVDIDGLIEGDSIEYIMVREEGDIVKRNADGTLGSYSYTFQVNGRKVTNDPEYMGNYKVTFVPGFLTITPATVTVTGGQFKKYYGDPDESWTDAWKATIGGLKNGDPESVIQYTQQRAEGETVTPDAAVSYKIRHDNPDEHPGYKITPSGEPEQGNYHVEYKPGKLEILKKSLTVKANNFSKKYGMPDNDPSLTSNWKPQVNGLISDDSALENLFTSSRLDTAKGENVKRPQQGQTGYGGYTITASGPDQLLDNYDVTYQEGTLTIMPRHLTVTSGSVTTLWDGQTELVCKNADCKDKYKEDHFVLTGDGLGFSDTLDVEITGSQAGLGSSYNKIGKVIINGTEEVSVPADDSGRPYIDTTPFKGNTTNYDIEVREGTLRLTGVTGVVITAKPQSKDYDSTPLTCTGYECISWVNPTGTELDEGDRIGSITISGSQTTANEGNPTKYVIESYTFVDKDNKDVTDKYVNVTVDEANATLTVRPVPLTITTESKIDFVYDGTPHSHKIYDYDGLKGEDKIDPASINITGAQTNAGESLNTMDKVVRIINQDGDDVTTSYIPDYYFGKLKVNPKPVTVTVGNYQKEYGMNDPAFTAEVQGTLPGDEGKISYTISREEGEDPGSYPVIPDGDEVQNNYTVIYVPGTLTVILNPTDQTVSKVWADDNNRDGLRPVSLGVTLTGSNGMRPVTRRLSADNNWTVTVPDLPVFYNGQRIVYEWTEDEIPGYTGTKQVNGNVTIFTNTHAVSRTSASVNKIWDDKDNAGNTRPASLRVVLRGNGNNVRGAVLNEANGWSETADDLPVYENGRPINYMWFEQSVGNGYYAVSSTTSGGTTTLVNSNLHRLTIHYRYNDGREAHADYTDRLYADEIFSVNSPLISGFTANPLTAVGVMPAHDFEIIVIYAAEGEEVVRPVVTPTPVPTVHPEDPHKDVPHPRDLDPDADHPLVVPVPNLLIEIDDLNTALGLGEVNASNYGFALE